MEETMKAPIPPCLRCRHRLPWYRGEQEESCELRRMGRPPKCDNDGDWADFKPDDRKADREAILDEWRKWEQLQRDLEQLELEKALGIVQEF